MASPKGDLAPYAELAEVIAALPLLLREARRARGLSQRAAAKRMGLAASTVHRVEKGHNCVLSHAATILRWLGEPGQRAEVHHGA
ncbi:hypothetical protein Skr01_36570 [Sphaerisporangium krabiense]|uniref:Ribosome-binding protein aMBF1 (Putative translation factor) n=1 Tax=Sphaerisporangium krabiense TaxID=763782 RepID=A0A7W8Z380_9ACTN|nr:helix-turn-helix transcriptional regulator [Sphaerisporangium krabiense]MBB5626652.1 ribosome-binding protein aMBF1 (putative translation factor) [Sphaerisporangium krabiense]GII63572.1 hypothetical protein Skr01_36570 [Sphaerisporangium krabiense]